MSAGVPVPPGSFAPLRGQLTDAATAFAGDADALAEILRGMVDDVDRAVREQLEVFPVCHHSPASGLAMVRRLAEKQPKVIYLELCEDFQPLLAELRNCQLPVAVQAFASELDGFPPDWAPLSVVAPITEASAEYQAIAYALETPGVELVLVDRSTDHVFQWIPRDPGTPHAGDSAAGDSSDGDSSDGAAADTDDATAPTDDAALHGDAVGIEIGDLRPGFAELERHLLHHGKVRHWSEWWDQYVEQPLAGADYDTYRQVMVLIGSLFRRLRPTGASRHDRDEDRERYMWTRIRAHLAASGVDRSACLYVCGAFHAASRVEQFGTDARDIQPGTPDFEISPRTGTTWLYGLIPSSHSAIEAQFGLAPGSVSIAASTWAAALTAGRITPYKLTGGKRGPAARTGGGKRAAPPPAAPPDPATDRLSGFLDRPPALRTVDETELLGWSVDIVRLARRNGYLASTADAIAVFETSILLAGMRNRRRPTPYDFQDAAVTCIEKETVPGRRDVRRLCEIMFGGDRVGTVGYDALPPLARDVHDRLAPLGLDLSRRTVQRALLDLGATPELVACSDLLWLLHRLMPEGTLRPIMGQRQLGERSLQESWDLTIGRNQRALIQLGYEGVTVEQVLEQRLRRTAYDAKATPAVVLAAVEDSVLFLRNRRFTEELGARAVALLATERTVDDAPEVLRRTRRLLAYYRSTGSALPAWCEAFARTGYAQYCTLLPSAFAAEDTGVRQVAAMLGFLFGMEGLALSLGCERTQLELAVRQSHPEAPAKVALLWAAQQQLGLIGLPELRARADALLDNPLVVPAFPQYLSGFVQALEPVPGLAPFVVEMLSKAFARLPDPVLLPWLPTLITTLKETGGDLMPGLVREAGRTFPGRLPALDAWRPPWHTAGPAGMPGSVPPPRAAVEVVGGPATDLLVTHPDTTDAMAAVLGCAGAWPERAGPTDQTGARADGTGAAPAARASAAAVVDLLARHPATGTAIARLVAVG